MADTRVRGKRSTNPGRELEAPPWHAFAIGALPAWVDDTGGSSHQLGSQAF
jgi:hypothetical protein